MTAAGDVYLWRNFPFRNGDKTDKLLVILGVDKVQYEVFCLRTTSEPNAYRPDGEGCHFDKGVHHFKNGNRAGFDVPTWIQFDMHIIKEVPVLQKSANYLFSLKPNDLRAIINCFKRSEDWADICKDFGM